MTLQEAITDGSIQLAAKFRLGQTHQAAALQLLIEAGKRVQKYRPLYAGKYPHLLPGETLQ